MAKKDSLPKVVVRKG